MKNKFPTIYSLSPSLYNMLYSKFGDSLDLEFESLFKFSIENGGLAEIDFVRPEGQSYNPRPARLVMILLSDGKESRQKLLLSAISSCASEHSDLTAREANQICKNPIDTKEYSKESKILALAAHLDRARHFHLSPNYKNEKKDFHNLTKKILDIAGSECQRVNELMAHWLRRDHERN